MSDKHQVDDNGPIIIYLRGAGGVWACQGPAAGLRFPDCGRRFGAAAVARRLGVDASRIDFRVL